MKKKIYVKENMSLADFKEFISHTYTGKYKNKYTLDESTWINMNTPMLIHCREHGWFKRKPSEFAKGFVCPYESNAMRVNIEWQKEAFKEKAFNKFGDRFTYNLEEYVDAKHHIIVTCKEHGDFEVTPENHLKSPNGGCAKCNKEYIYSRFSKTNEAFITDSKKIWGDNMFKYDNVNYINRTTPVTLTCIKHNTEFNQVPYKHLLHHVGCPVCYSENMRERLLMNTDSFIEKANKVHKNQYDYTQTDTKQRNKDRYEDDIINYIKTVNSEIEIEHGNRTILNGRELDIYLPSIKLAVEFNGLHWHTEEFNRGSDYHLSKLLQCNNKGIRLIQIFEDEWLEHKDIVLSKIKHLIKSGDYSKKIRGHKCIIKSIDTSQAKSFLNSNHIQGYSSGSVMIGAYFNDELIGVSIFKKINSNNIWELVRMATKNDYLCHGVCGKMFKHFVDDYKPHYIKSFADRRWTLNSTHNIYTILNFNLEKVLKPDYRYVIANKRIHKFNCRKNILHKKFNLPLTMSENEMTQFLGYYKIWDCGLFKYVWKRDS